MIETFGQFHNQDVKRVTIAGGGLTANILTFGACLQDLRLVEHDHSLVLGYEKFQHYLDHSPYFGMSVGRYANRIRNGQFSIGHSDYQLDQNEPTGNHLHGGKEGISQQIWDIETLSENEVSLSIAEPDGRSGYPGACQFLCVISLLEGGVLRFRYETRSDQPTIANVTHHSYFNLDGSDDVYDHDLQISAEHYLPVDESSIPLGEPVSVADTEFDFRSTRSIRSSNGFVAYDHNFCLSDERVASRLIASASSKKSGVSMDVHSTEPGVQFYTGKWIDSPVEGLDGKQYGAGAGFCLETQNWPDAPNQANYPNAILRPGEVLVQETDYIFRKK